MRILCTLALGMAMLVTTTTRAAAGEIKIGWYGQSMFQIVTPKGTKIVLDPHNIEAYRITPIKVDLVLVTHDHNDHDQLEAAIENAKTVKKFSGTKKEGDRATLDWNEVKDKFADASFFTVPTYHDASRGMKYGKNSCWVIDIDGLRIAHLGDLGHTLNDAQLKKFGKVDVLMVPVGGVYSLNGLTAYEVVKQIKPTRYIIPMHYGTIVYDDLLALKTFSDECKDDEVPIETFGERKWLTIDTKKQAPKRASMAVLHYMGPGMGEIKIELKDKGKDKEKDKDK